MLRAQRAHVQSFSLTSHSGRPYFHTPPTAHHGHSTVSLSLFCRMDIALLSLSYPPLSLSALLSVDLSFTTLYFSLRVCVSSPDICDGRNYFNRGYGKHKDPAGSNPPLKSIDSRASSTSAQGCCINRGLATKTAVEVER